MNPQPKNDFNRNELILMFIENNYRVGAEIGVWKGYFSRQLCKRVPGLKLYCIDLWEPFSCDFFPKSLSKSSASENKKWYFAFESKEWQDSFYRSACWRLSKYNAIIIRKASMEAVKDFPEGSLDFIYIDANHSYDFVMQDLIEWSKRVRIGGIISGHDYDPDWGVKQAVDDYVRINNIDNCFYSGKTGQSSSFWWMKK